MDEKLNRQSKMRIEEGGWEWELSEQNDVQGAPYKG